LGRKAKRPGASPLESAEQVARNDRSPFSSAVAAEEYRGISYIVRDANKFPVAYVYFETEPGRRAAANLISPGRVKPAGALLAVTRCTGCRRGQGIGWPSVRRVPASRTSSDMWRKSEIDALAG
jgi:hypothetical protein